MGEHIRTKCDYWQILFACVLLIGLITQVQGDVPLTLVDGAVQKGAVCLDGSPAGYHYDPGVGDGANNWIVYLMGGGWCGKWTCFRRLGQFHGSTNNIGPENFTGILSSNQASNPDFYNWNRVFVRYCDGGSFLGDTEQVDNGYNVQLRGAKIFSAVMDELLQVKGMKNANNVILTGVSAGGLATILNCDRFRALFPSTTKVKCIADSGFFIRAKDLPYANFRERVFAGVIAFHNLTDILPTTCTSKMNASLCLFPEYLVGDVQTPLFILNPAFDNFQIRMNLKPNPLDEPGWNGTCVDGSAAPMDIPKPPKPDICTPNQMQLIKDFHGAFLDAINGFGDNPSRGLFINSCYSHVFLQFDELWNGTPCKLEDKTIAQAISDWYFDRSGVKLIDTKNDLPLACQ